MGRIKKRDRLTKALVRRSRSINELLAAADVSEVFRICEAQLPELVGIIVIGLHQGGDSVVTWSASIDNLTAMGLLMGSMENFKPQDLGEVQ